MVDTSDEWIMQRVGVRERRIADKGMATSDMAKEASLIFFFSLKGAVMSLLTWEVATPRVVVSSGRGCPDGSSRARR